jgi:hypothetical protein
MLVILAGKGVISAMIPAADRAIRRHVATRRAAGQQPGKIRGPRHGRPGAARSGPTHGPAPRQASACTSPATPGAPGLSDTEGSRRAIGPGS